ncbi:MAG TPA: choice-of-anchor Q domain-containing protein [Streptosporangiaceae bacterium]
MSASTFSRNGATQDGEAIDNADYGGRGQMIVTASTFTGNRGPARRDDRQRRPWRGGSVTVAADVFSGGCRHPRGIWNDLGYNAGSGATCFAAAPPGTDVDTGSVAALKLGTPARNGGPTRTVLPQPGSPVIGIIPDPAAISVGARLLTVCPATDQRGYSSAPGPCDAGSVQTTATAAVAGPSW